MGFVAELCRKAILHAGELLVAEVSSISLVKKEKVITLTALECLLLCSLSMTSESKRHVRVKPSNRKRMKIK